MKKELKGQYDVYDQALICLSPTDIVILAGFDDWPVYHVFEVEKPANLEDLVTKK